jgi:diacylglycerol kinase family enzyme
MIKGPGHGIELARTAASAGAERVLCAGGDGTLNAVATGLIGTGVPLGVVPMGSGNGYSRSLELPRGAEEALRVAFTGASRSVDVGYLKARLFLGTVGIGFDARVADRFDRSKRRGMVGYLKIILEEIAGAETTRVRLNANGVKAEFRREATAAAGAGEWEGGGGAGVRPPLR